MRGRCGNWNASPRNTLSLCLNLYLRRKGHEVDTNGVLFVVSGAAFGFFAGYVLKRQRDLAELKALRALTRSNQQNHVNHMEAVMRGKRNDQAK